VFALSLLVFETDHYVSSVVPAVYQLKLDTWGHEAVVLHSRDIRKALGPCQILADPARRMVLERRQ